MEESFICDLIEMAHLGELREKLRNDESYNCVKDDNAALDKLKNTLNPEQFKLVKDYIFQNQLKEEFIYYQSDIKLLNYGIKIGMQIQKSFDDDEA